MISLKNLPGRFGNHFFRNIVLHFLVEKYNFTVEYVCIEEFKKMGIELKNGSIINRNYQQIQINDNNILSLLDISENLSTYDFTIKFHTYFQKKEIALKIYDYFHKNETNKNNVLNANIFNYRINNNNDVFLHIRIGDVPQFNPGYDYYDKLLSNLDFEYGYISSDTIEDELCKKLIEKYNLEVVNKDEVETIMFANTCKYLILSQGTFSWLMGLFAYYSDKIYYPKIKTEWHGDIFVFPGLIEVDY
jgi:hypothetical protein